jgi:hypothetical protein
MALSQQVEALRELARKVRKAPDELYEGLFELEHLMALRQDGRDRSVETAHRAWDTAEALVVYADDMINEARYLRREASKRMARLRRSRALG